MILNGIDLSFFFLSRNEYVFSTEVGQFEKIDNGYRINLLTRNVILFLHRVIFGIETILSSLVREILTQKFGDHRPLLIQREHVIGQVVVVSQCP